MAEEEDISELEILATLDALGELDSEEDAARLAAALEEDPELARDHAILKGVGNELESSVREQPVPEMPSEMPPEMLAALGLDGEDGPAEANGKVVSISFFSNPVLWMAVAAAVVVLIGIAALMGPEKGPQPVFAMHSEALEAARGYPMEFTKSPQLPPEHTRLVAHLEYLIGADMKAEAKEILEALPEAALQLPDFKRLKRAVP